MAIANVNRVPTPVHSFGIARAAADNQVILRKIKALHVAYVSFSGKLRADFMTAISGELRAKLRVADYFAYSLRQRIFVARGNQPAALAVDDHFGCTADGSCHYSRFAGQTFKHY